MTRPRYLTINGQTMRIYEWAKYVDIPAKTIESRLRKGYSPEDAVFTPTRTKGAHRAEELIRKGFGAERMEKLRKIIRQIRNEAIYVQV